ncbi:UNVERIFIED_CONTAM: hypothetical protein FKN15_033641 [Acipenser sinensis]
MDYLVKANAQPKQQCFGMADWRTSSAALWAKIAALPVGSSDTQCPAALCRNKRKRSCGPKNHCHSRRQEREKPCYLQCQSEKPHYLQCQREEPLPSPEPKRQEPLPSPVPEGEELLPAPVSRAITGPTSGAATSAAEGSTVKASHTARGPSATANVGATLCRGHFF